MSIFRHSTVAQQRRCLESVEFKKLSAVLPISRAISEQHLDKNTIVRLASTYIRLHKCIRPISSGFHKYDVPFTQLVELLDGFLICLSETYDVLYVSENISLHLGLSQVEMTGNPFWMYINEQDFPIVNQVIRAALHNQGEAIRTTVRMKSTLTKRSSKETLKVYAGFKTLTIEMSAKLQPSSNRPYFVGFCQPHPIGLSSSRLSLNRMSFVVDTDLELKIQRVDTKDLDETFLSMHAPKLDEQISYYNLVHVEDSEIVREMHQNVLRSGSVISGYYRITTSCGEFFYVETYAFCYTTRSRVKSASEIVMMNTIIG